MRRATKTVTDDSDRGDASIGARLMYTRTTIVFALANASCSIPGIIGDLPTSTDSGSADDDTGVGPDSGADGHSSQSAGDDAATTETTFVPGDDGGDDDDDGGDDDDDDDGGGGDTTGSDSELCEREPSGYAPGTLIWEMPMPELSAHELISTPDAIWMIGESDVDGAMTLARASHDGGSFETTIWPGPESVSKSARHLVALPNGRIVAGFDVALTEDPCASCAERFLVAYDSLAAPAWELSLGQGTWGVTISQAGTIYVVGSVLEPQRDAGVTLMEYDPEGNLIRLLDDALEGSTTPIVTRAYSTGAAWNDLIGVGTLPFEADAAWTNSWGEDFDHSWGFTSAGPIYSFATVWNGDFVQARTKPPLVLERKLSALDLYWEAGLAEVPNAIATDCDDSIVLAGDTLERRSGDGSVQWSQPAEATIRRVTVTDNGDILVLFDPSESQMLQRRAAL
jgi:hypothetical protein